jgi:hypothetical protein
MIYKGSYPAMNIDSTDWEMFYSSYVQTYIERDIRDLKSISDEQLFYCQQRGIDKEAAISLIVNGYAKDVLNKLPMEFAVEAQKLLAISLEGSVG